MKCKIPEISWHNRDPVLSVDIQPKSGTGGGSSAYRLATGGTDSHVLIWYINYAENGTDLMIDVAADLTRHQRAVNVVKWSPNGELLASGDDESVIFIWKQKADSETLNILDDTSEQDKEIWITLKVLRGHMEDVYDLSWCPQSLFLVSGSVDNSAMIWDVHKGKSLAILNDHKGFVQGVAWDPRNQYIATLSTDRYMRIFDIQTKRVLHRVSKASLPVPADNPLYGKRMRIYHDDTLQTFFRRLCFTPDGKLLLTPAGLTDYDGVTQPLHTSYIYSRYALRQPAIVLPCPDQYTVAIKCCPLLFKLRAHDSELNPPVVPLPYRMIFAIATKSSVYLYDTQQKQPFGLISNIHYTRLTDITWSSDGCIIVVSSTDGFCSLITFEPGELGEEYEESAAVMQKMREEQEKKEKKTTKKQKESDGQKVDKKARQASADEEKIRDEAAAAMPIAIKRKPAVTSTTVPPSTEQSLNSTAAPIAAKRKSSELETDDEKTTEKTTTVAVKRRPSAEQNSAPVATNKLLLSDSIAAEIILDKEILSSDEKFESPEKRSRPATPISVRRHPRTPSSALQTPTTTTTTTPLSKRETLESLKMKPASEQSPLCAAKHLNTPRQVKSGAATPIAVRRTPRALIRAPTPVDKTAIADEAMDAWPLGDENDVKDEAKVEKCEKLTTPTRKSSKTMVIAPAEVTSDRTEDMRLVYEDTVEATMQETPKKSANDEKKQEVATNATKTEQKTEIEVKQSENTADNKVTPKKKQSNVAGDTAEIAETKTDATDKTEDASIGTMPNTPKQANARTPRRVELKTISTPKSKKKLLD